MSAPLKTDLKEQRLRAEGARELLEQQNAQLREDLQRERARIDRMQESLSELDKVFKEKAHV